MKAFSDGSANTSSPSARARSRTESPIRTPTRAPWPELLLAAPLEPSVASLELSVASLEPSVAENTP